MRLDKFLKNTGIMKRRTLAKRICDGGHCSVNGKRSKPGSTVAVGDIIRLQVGMNVAEYEVLRLAEREVRKDERDGYRRQIGSDRVDPLADLEG